MINIADIDIAEGATKRMDCPSCKGKNTFTVSKLNGVVIFNCYKSGCDARGASMVGMTAAEIKAALASRQSIAESKLEVDAPTMELPVNFSYDLSDKRVQDFIKRWDLEGTPMLYDVAACRVHFIIHSAKGRIIDTVGRTLRGDTPKWLRTSGKADYYKRGDSSVAVVVEDAISACAVAKHVPNATGFALLGTNLNDKHIEALQKYDKVLIALDPDAALKSLELVQKCKSRSIEATAVMLKNDVKYLEDVDIVKLRAICS